MKELLSAFLERAAGRKFTWGRTDCCLFAADWVLELEGIDPAENIRGRYATEIGAKRRVTALGGLEALMGAAVGKIGWTPRSEARIGDVGCVQVQGWKGPVISAAVCTGSRWALLGPSGLLMSPAPCLAAWGR